MMMFATTTAAGMDAAVRSVNLPPPPAVGAMSLEEALTQRRSVREFIPGALTLSEVSRLLWAAQGSTGSGRRTAPSAGATYPLEVYLVAGNVEGLSAGVYRYLSNQHRLESVSDAEILQHMGAAALEQRWVERAAAVVVIAAVFERTTAHYGNAGERYVHMESGHAAQNLLLQAAAIGLCVTPVGAFNDRSVSRLLQLPARQTPLYLLPVGRCAPQ
ncbi:MAG TPA: SagB/ThcOx family dehydrogenase [Gallionellaceae bacterium]|nr:SagB/ThcOx family dehydrogenase [Gallionellaceae bacterium]